MASVKTGAFSIAQILNNCQLFGGLTDGQREALASRCSLRTYAPGQLLCAEGEPGDELFVLVLGILEVYTTAPDDSEVVLVRRDKPGEYLGEQAVRRKEETKRTASVRADAESEVIVIPKDVFQEFMSAEGAILARLQTEGMRQAEQLTLVQKSAMYRILVAFDNQGGWSRTETFADGEIVFGQGEPADRVYVILSGEALVTRETDGNVQTLAVLKEGQCFGEAGVMDRAPRRATITARGPLTTLSVSGSEFMQAAAVSPELHDYMASLRRVYTLAGAGTATQFDGTFMGHSALVTMIRMPNGTTVIANNVVDYAIYSSSVRLPPETQLEEVVYEDKGRHIRREIGLREGRLARLFAQGPWEELGQIHNRLLEQAPIEREKVERFTRTGLLMTEAQIKEEGPEQVICFCLGVTLGAIEACIAKGCKTLRQAADTTGATTVCGGCTGRVAARVGDVDGVLVRLAQIAEVAPGVRSFRFVPIEEGSRKAAALRPCMPGHHVIVAAQIDGRWVARPYTLTSASCESTYREVTVKREAHGHFSNWLFEEAKVGAQLQLSHPQGAHGLDIDIPDPIICLVAGIGMTPALATARSVASTGAKLPLHIDYSVRFERELAYREELQALATAHPNITLTIRNTAAGGRIGRKDLEAYRARFPQARYFICGPLPFQQAVVKGLQEVGVPDACIHFEEFTPVGHPPKQAAEPRARADVVFMGVGLVLLAAYLAQTVIGWQWTSLAELQRQTAFRWGSGFVLLAFFAFQWYLPVLRLAGKVRQAAVQYPPHKYLGAFAPVFFFLHAPRPGHGLLFALASIYLANTLTGLLDKTILQNPERRESYARSWLFVHVTLSMLATGLAFLHVFTILAY